MKPTHFLILFVGILHFGACSTYETRTVITPHEEVGKYWAQASIVHHRLLRAPQTVMGSGSLFDPEGGAGASSGTGSPDKPEQVVSIQILPSREKEPQAVEVHYHVDKQPGRPPLDRREWVKLPPAM